VYEGGFPVDAIDDRKFEFRRPDGRMVSTGGPQTQTTTDIGILNCRLGLHIDADSAVTRWAGEPIDCGLAIDGLLWFDRPNSERTTERMWRGICAFLQEHVAGVAANVVSALNRSLRLTQFNGVAVCVALRSATRIYPYLDIHVPVNRGYGDHTWRYC
jgi:hypothetical protein